MKDIRNDFPALRQKVYGKPLIYLDSAATTLKPQAVIDAVTEYYATVNSNVHRGNHFLSTKATEAFEAARERVREFINAGSTEEIIFTKGTTESINLVAHSFAGEILAAGDEILISAMEHHANIVPWQQICKKKGATLNVIPVAPEGELVMDVLDTLLTEKTKLVCITHASNTLGTINPVKTIIEKAHSKNIPVLIDGAQGIVHERVDVRDLDADFYAFSGHKIYGPMGIGILYGKKQWLDKMMPYQYGGEMIDKVSFEETSFNRLPYKFEAGTPNVAGAAGLHAALDYLENIDFEQQTRREEELLEYATARLKEIQGLVIYGTAARKVPLISFVLEGIHPYDTGTLLDKSGIAVRTGNHCTQPLMKILGINGTVRASFGIYNTLEEVDKLYDALLRINKMFGVR